MNFTLRIFRQDGPDAEGRLETHELRDVRPDSSFLEMLDMLNERLSEEGREPIAFDSDCREGICGACSLMINGIAHGPERETASCQLHMRSFEDGAEITIEPFRARSFPIVRDLVVDRSAFDRIVEAGGYVSVNTGSAPDANSIPVPRRDADRAFDAATCIGCGACVAACKKASAMLFLGAKVAHFARLPQGQPERRRRVLRMAEQADAEGFGACTNQYECEAVCPKGISRSNIAFLNREYVRALLLGPE